VDHYCKSHSFLKPCNSFQTLDQLPKALYDLASAGISKTPWPSSWSHSYLLSVLSTPSPSLLCKCHQRRLHWPIYPSNLTNFRHQIFSSLSCKSLFSCLVSPQLDCECLEGRHIVLVYYCILTPSIEPGTLWLSMFVECIYRCQAGVTKRVKVVAPEAFTGWENSQYKNPVN
jgi:hypothetical protein